MAARFYPQMMTTENDKGQFFVIDDKRSLQRTNISRSEKVIGTIS